MRKDNIYVGLLDKTFRQIREECENLASINSVRRVVLFRNNPALPSIYETSDIVMFFDMLDEEALPLLLVERVPVEEVDTQELDAFIKQYNANSASGYTITSSVNTNTKYVDITVLRTDIWDTLCKDDGEVTCDEVMEVVTSGTDPEQ